MQMSRNVVHQGSCPIAACLCRVWIADLQRLSIGPGSGVQSLLGTSLPLILSFMSCIQQRTYPPTFPHSLTYIVRPSQFLIGGDVEIHDSHWFA